ncbi:MAG: undecaprenyl-diphosphate phosphatase [Candidatus Omnitrophica bacterium]|jgi:undecaprenyl-diphosphatase|nr:undecaprenyl-diphosphate phosphatase [Candidatus Omnitrophota bacterium]
MNLITAVIFGVVEGITEFLPISSTGHLILTADLLKTPQTEFLKSFEIAIQLGAILSVVVLYWKSFLIKIPVLKKITVAFIPTALIGLSLYKVLKSFLLQNSSIVLWSLLAGGIFIIIFEIFYRQEKATIEDISLISYPKAFLIGIFQSIAIIPGVSRSAATIIGGLILGLKRKTIVEFSFLLAVPTMLAATVFDLTKSAGTFNSGQFIYLVVGFIVSFVTACFAIKFLLYFIKNHNFILFAIYRIVLAIAMFIFLS